jgi:hypothetical protein
MAETGEVLKAKGQQRLSARARRWRPQPAQQQLAPPVPLSTPAGWIGRRALLLSPYSEGLPKASSLSVSWQVT